MNERPGFYWKLSVIRGGCVMCAEFGVSDTVHVQRKLDLKVLEAHHIIRQQYLKRDGLDHLLWDPRNGLCLCRYHHQRHTACMQKVPAALLPDEAWQFAEEHGLIWVIDREYS